MYNYMYLICTYTRVGSSRYHMQLVVLVPYTHTYLFVLAGYADATHDDSSSYIFGQHIL